MSGGWSEEASLLEAKGIRLAPGLTSEEFSAVEDLYDFEFPDDLRSMLREFMPVGNGFPDWRDPTGEFIVDGFGWPFRGIAFDIEQDSFWWSDWGPKPSDEAAALAIAREAVAAAPTLIPIHAHRYLPSRPRSAGNPVFSVWQADIIYYGADLRSYLRCEFGDLSLVEAIGDKQRRIEFWTALEAANGP